MNAKIISVLCLLVVTFVAVKGEEFESELDNYDTKEETTFSDEQPKKTAKKTVVVEDPGSETSSLIQQDSGDSDADKHKGFCHWGIAVWYKPGVQIRCNCMRCTCKEGGAWDCNYFFPYCPYYYCGNQIYNPATQVCCCGKVYGKKANWACCGYFYYDRRISQCCHYYSVKPAKAKCPRFKV